MVESGSILKRRPPVATLVGGAIFLAGFLLAAIDWRFLGVSAFGAFGPGILREMGWVKDKDEFQLEAARRAGYHAYLAGGFLALVLIGVVRAADDEMRFPSELVSGILGVMWVTWLFSSLHAYWGASRTVSRILIIFGSIWLVFNVIGNIQGGIVALVMQSSLALPFFLLAWLANRWPRVAGVILLGIGAFFFYFFGLYEILGADPLAKGRLSVIILFIGPLVASGLMLLGQRASSSGGEA
jgi:hypothetical protein